MENIRQIVKRVWGYDALLPLQEEAIGAVLARRDSIVVLPTGGGKSLCYQAPAAAMGGAGGGGVAADLADEGSGGRPHRRRGAGGVPEQQPDGRGAARGWRPAWPAGEYQLLYVAPERLVLPTCLGLLQAGRRGVLRHRRGALHQPVGARLPAGVSAAHRAAGGLPGRGHPCLHRHGHAAGADGHRHASWRCATLRSWSGASTARTWSTGSASARTGCGRSRRRWSGTGERPGSSTASAGRRWISSPRRSRRRGNRAVAYHAGLADAERTAHPGRLRHGAGGCGGGHGGVRDGHRPVRRAVRDPRRHAEVPRALPAGGGPGRARRPAGGVPAALLRRRLRLVAVHPDGGGTPGAGRPPEARGDVRLLPGGRLPAPVPGGVLRSSIRRGPVRGLRRLPRRVAVKDGSAALARQILACVVEMGERFGADYVADVLRGAETARIARMRHDRLETYGVLRQRQRRRCETGSRNSRGMGTWPATRTSTRRSA